MNTPKESVWSDIAPVFYALEDKAIQEWHATLAGFYRDSKRLDWLMSDHGLLWLTERHREGCPIFKADIDQAMAHPPK